MDNDDALGRLIDVEDVPLLAAVILLPWAFGGVEPWSFRCATLLVAIAGGVALVRRGWAGWGLAARSAAWLAPAFLLLAWALFQVVPLPPGLLARISPSTHEIYESAMMLRADGRVLERFEEAALARVSEATAPIPEPGPENPPARASLPAPASVVVSAPEPAATEPGPTGPPDCLDGDRRPISLEPAATRERAVWYATLLLAFLLVRVRAAESDRAAVYIAALATNFAALAAVGLLQAYTWDGALLWLREIPSDRNPFGPYVNRVHFGGAMELGAPLLLALAIQRWRRFGRDAMSEPVFAISAVGSVTTVVALLASLSKAAVVLAAGSIFMLIAASVRSSRMRVAILIAALVVGLGIGFVASGAGIGSQFESFTDRLGQGHDLEGRGAIWESATSMFRDFPITGTGFGSFTEVFPRYQPSGAHARWTRAHNDYLELALDGGAIALILALLVAVGYALRLGRRLRAGGWSPVRVALALGVASLAAHALVDFNHQIPANALLFVAVAALASDAALEDEEQ